MPGSWPKTFNHLTRVLWPRYKISQKSPFDHSRTCNHIMESSLIVRQPGRRCCRSGVRWIPLGAVETSMPGRGWEPESWPGRPSLPRCVCSVWGLKFFQPFKTWRNPYPCPTFHHGTVSFLTPVSVQHRSLCVDLSRETPWAGRSHLPIPQQLTPQLSVKAAGLLHAS